jgi:hypothetical protein
MHNGTSATKHVLQQVLGARRAAEQAADRLQSSWVEYIQPLVARGSTAHAACDVSPQLHFTYKHVWRQA